MIKEVKRIYKDENPLNNPKFVMSGHEEGIISFGKSLKEAEMVILEIVGEYCH